MSAELDRRLREDRVIRDAARALLKADIAHLRADLSGKSLGQRFVGKVSEGAADVFEEAARAADNNRGALAALAAAILLWFARNPVMGLIMGLFDDEEPDPDNRPDNGPDTQKNDTGAPTRPA